MIESSLVGSDPRGYDPGVDATRLAALIGPDSSLSTPIVVASTGSTNADLASGSYGWAAGRVLISNHQSAGRGRFDRRWEAEPGQAIATSVLLRPARALHDWGWLSFLIGMAVQATISELPGAAARVTLKWPNDVLVDERKICGILSEHHIAPDGGHVAICGWGLNVQMSEAELPVPTATSISLADLPVDHTRLAAAMLNHFDELYRAWDAGADLRAHYRELCSTLGRRVRVQLDVESLPDRFVEGIALDVTEDGSLIVRDTDGSLQRFSAGDVVHLRPATASEER